MHYTLSNAQLMGQVGQRRNTLSATQRMLVQQHEESAEPLVTQTKDEKCLSQMVAKKA